MNEVVAPTPRRLNADFCLTIDFVKGQGNPSRVFRAMSDMIEAFQKLDETLIQSIHSEIEPVILLEDVEVSSIKAWLKQKLSAEGGDGLKESWDEDTKRFLVEGKGLVVDFMGSHTIVTDTNLQELQDGLNNLAASADGKQLAFHQPVARKPLLEAMCDLVDARSVLEEGDVVIYSESDKKATFTAGLAISPQTINELTVKEKSEGNITMTLKVKKADFTGESMWQFHHGKSTLDITIGDKAWLSKYQAGRVTLLPGYAINAKVKIETEYGFQDEVVNTHHTITQVLEVRPPISFNQGRIFDEGDNPSGITLNRNSAPTTEPEKA